ncbi:MAG: hypothetical protein AB8B85_15160 [Paracoccaceae bacterium]
MPRTLIALGALVLMVAPVAPTMAQGTCEPGSTVNLLAANRKCPEDIRKVSCGGTSIDLAGDAKACCKLKPSKTVSWRCGTDESIDFTCKGSGKTAEMLSVRRTSNGVKFVCLGAKETPPPEQAPAPAAEADNSN